VLGISSESPSVPSDSWIPSICCRDVKTDEGAELIVAPPELTHLVNSERNPVENLEISYPSLLKLLLDVRNRISRSLEMIILPRMSPSSYPCR
jgi:hypothetical protein